MQSFSDSLKDYQFIQQIGVGAFAKVYTVQYDHKEYALKQIDMELNDLTQAYQEIKILDQLRHPNIVQLQYCFSEKNYVNIIEECAQCNLRHVLRQKQLTEPQMAYIIQQILLGLQYLHEQKVVHRDLKPQNVLLTNEIVKICDFGVSTYITSTMTKHFTNVGTAHYISPEQYSDKGVTFTSDLWALGILLTEMITQDLPFKDLSPLDLAKTITQGSNSILNFIDQRRGISGKLREFLGILLNKNPQSRQSAQLLLEHKFVKIANSSGLSEVSQAASEQLKLLALPITDNQFNQAESLEIEWEFPDEEVNKQQLLSAFQQANVYLNPSLISEKQAKQVIQQLQRQEEVKPENMEFNESIFGILKAVQSIK